MGIILDSIYIAIVAVIFSCILIEDEMIFSFYGRLLDKLPKYIAYPLGSCAYCFGGQIALWRYFFFEDYNFFNHIVFVSVTIFFIHIILFIYERTQ